MSTQLGFGSRESAFGSRAIAAMFAILLTGLAAFCRYYPWQSPPPAAGPTAAASTLGPTSGMTTVSTGKP